MLWKEDYCLGVEHIDRQHKELFTVINRITRILDEEDSERNRRACVEAIKYLKGYALRHFADEEAYQLEIRYPYYESHKRQHEVFTGTVLELEQDMLASDFSRDSIRRFLGVLTSWLVYHIMDSDQAIAGRRTHPGSESDAKALMRRLVEEKTQELFGIRPELCDDRAAGEVFCRVRCATPDGLDVTGIFSLERSFVQGIISAMMDLDIEELDVMARSALEELSGLLTLQFAQFHARRPDMRLESSQILTAAEAEAAGGGQEPALSLSFRSDSGGLTVRVWGAAVR